MHPVRSLLCLSCLLVTLSCQTGSQSGPEGVDDSTTVASPELDLNRPLGELSVAELRLKRNRILAEKGYLFKDEILRSYFRQQPWYDPVHVYDSLKQELTQAEDSLTEKIRRLEKERLSRNYVEKGGRRSVNTANLANAFQFPAADIHRMQDQLAVHGFTVVPGNAEQLFQIYDHYDHIPNFVTTDLYLQLLHTYFSYLLRQLEERYLMDLVTDITRQLYERSVAVKREARNMEVIKAAGFNQLYFGLAYRLMTGESLPVPNGWEDAYEKEYTQILQASGAGSAFLRYNMLDYTLFKPRGHYTRNPRLKKYFKAMIWLQSAPFLFSNPSAFNAMILTAHLLKQEANRSLHDNILFMDRTLGFLAGSPDNLSLDDLMEILTTHFPDEGISDLLDDKPIQRIRKLLARRDPRRIRARGADSATQASLDQKKIYFMPQRYTFDAEIMQRLVSLEKDDRQQPFRPLPKGLDIFAVLGNQTAETILQDTYHTGEQWPAFPDTLLVLKQQFKGFGDREETFYNQWMKGLSILGELQSPFFMTGEGWQLKCLNTALASWTELKHNLILYAKQPSGAPMENGEDEDYPDPVMPGYVEPHVKFWQNCLELMDGHRQLLAMAFEEEPDLANRADRVRDIAARCKDISIKELARKKLSDEEYEFIKYIGGEVEFLTLEIMEAGSWSEVIGPDKFMAVVADVYSHINLDPSKSRVLTQGVGFADEIYVVVEIDGYLYLARGGVFSYYEFEVPERLTDETWQLWLKENKAPQRPSWMEPILTNR